ncbi:hypothetical protein MFLO_03063 [Listeria floridensis FSL S10-1187]|uniref:DUF1700 domain-containing protein n=1 Tax=Listeria floridensis FSL S10-1187 TaxID=1265817 RepID=A0ABN0RHV5_9LIST|nr:DUF1700 domain-containing protein [Listeria floridensis]EUJ33489.1 hypothetical protein MFLO_03063 [Listeria floridensis FSL S10-1187]
MNKQSFLKQLQKAFAGLPKEEREELLQYYEEYLNNPDFEEKTLDDIQAEIGTPDQIAQAYLEANSEIELEKQAYNRMRRLGFLKQATIFIGFTLLALILSSIFISSLVGIVLLALDVWVFQQLQVFQIFAAVFLLGLIYLTFLIIKHLYSMYHTRKGRFS